MQELNKLLIDLDPISIVGDTKQTITEICDDSRKLAPGKLFVAIKGVQADGHKYIGQAIDLGCTALIVEDLPEEQKSEVCYIQVKDSRLALAQVAANIYGHPSRDIKLVGITGTNGKTTTATLLYKTLQAAGIKAGLLSTVANFIDGKEYPATHTTGNPLELNKLFREMVDAGCQYAFMEVSSHAIEQKRVAGLHFDGAVFTNLTRDHLDYHGDMLSYLNAKKSFFDQLPPSSFALSNADEKNGTVMLQNCKAKPYYYALRTMADYKCKIMEQHLEGMLLEINGQELFVQLLGAFNAYNITAVYATLLLLGFEQTEVLRLLSAQKSVDGRFETFRSEKGYVGIVDYAHTPDALVNVLDTIEPLAKGHQIICVVGAGGNRDKGKRPLMAAEAAKRSSKLILTADNPRNEEVDDIIDDMLAGLDSEARKRCLCISNRRQAIRTACALAQKGDLILIAGKGHETYQEIKGERTHFDDREELVAAMNENN